MIIDILHLKLVLYYNIYYLYYFELLFVELDQLIGTLINSFGYTIFYDYSNIKKT